MSRKELDELFHGWVTLKLLISDGCLMQVEY
jgi:hypothetical protein